VVGLAAQDYLIPWRRNALQTGLLATAFLVLTLLGAWVLLASWERDRAAEARIITERERQRSAQALLEMEAQFQQAQKMESLGILAGGVAHDMNNVLGAILAVASSQLGTQPEGSPLHLALDTITRAAVRGGTMVKGLLSFARRTPGEVRELDLNAVIRDAVELLARTTLAQVRLDLRLADGLRPVTGDASALSHALINLCVNAVDAMGGAGTLTLTTRNDGEAWVLVQVEDTGSGMAPEVLAKALDPFFTTKAHGKGTGLGLSLVYSSVKAHQGDMEIRSEPGRGTQISLRFPAAEPQAFAPAGPGPDRTAPPARRLQVLLVDDDELIQISTHMLLDMLGHATTVASSGEEALRLLGEGLQPDAVVLDMNMPGLGGAGTLGPLRGLCPEVPVILATGRADQDAMALVASGTRITLLAKPYSLGELQEQLTVLCDRTVGS